MIGCTILNNHRMKKKKTFFPLDTIEKIIHYLALYDLLEIIAYNVLCINSWVGINLLSRVLLISVSICLNFKTYYSFFFFYMFIFKVMVWVRLFV